MLFLLMLTQTQLHLEYKFILYIYEFLYVLKDAFGIMQKELLS